MELEQLYQALRNADALAQQGDEQAASDAREIARMIREAEGAATEPREEVGVAEDVARSGLGGLAAGTEELFDLAGRAFYAPQEAVYRGVQALGQRFLGEEAPAWMRSEEPMTPQELRVQPGFSDIPAFSSAMEYEPQTLPGEYSRTIGTFAPGAALPIGPGGLVPRLAMGALLPGAASEFAGQTTEALGGGETAQGLARLAAAIGAPMAAGAAMAGVRSALTSGARAYEPGSTRLQSAQILQDAGVDLSAGQRLGAPRLMMAEGAEEITDDVTRGLSRVVMSELGSPDPRPTPSALGRVEEQLGRIFDEAADIRAVPTQSTVDDMIRAFDDYLSARPTGDPAVPRGLVAIMDDFASSLQRGDEITGRQIQEWRDILRNIVERNARDNPSASLLAREISGAMDDVIVEGAAATNPDLYARLLDARNRYRTLLDVIDAMNVSGSDAAAGLMSPQRLGTIVRRSEGRRAISLRPSAAPLRPISEIGRAAQEVASPLPTVRQGGVRSITQLGPLLPAVGGGGIATALGASPEVAGMTLLGGLAAPTVSRAAIRSRYIQEMLMRDPSLRTAIGEQATTAARLVPGLLAQD